MVSVNQPDFTNALCVCVCVGGGGGGGVRACVRVWVYVQVSDVVVMGASLRGGPLQQQQAGRVLLRPGKEQSFRHHCRCPGLP